MKSVKVGIALAVTAAAVALAPPAGAAMPIGNYSLNIEGRRDFHTWIWAVAWCEPNCVLVSALAQPIAKAFQFTQTAQLADGRYAMTVDDPYGLRCGNIYYGPTIPTRDVYTWDAATLVGSMTSSFDAGCDGALGRSVHLPVQPHPLVGQSITAASLRSVIGRASSCSSQIRCSLSSVSSRPGPSLGPGVNAAGRCCMPWMTPIVS